VPRKSDSSSLDFLAPSVSTYPLVVGAGDSIDVVIRFQPTSPGAKSGVINIVSNATGSPHSVPVSGKCGAPHLDLIIADHGAFGSTCRGAHRDAPLILSNGGACGLQVTDISSTSVEFQVPETLSFPLSIAPGTNLAVPIRFAPTKPGAASATVKVTSNDPAGPRTIDVTGSSASGRLSIGGSSIFGAVCCDKREQRILWLSNTGGCDLAVESVALRHPRHALRLVNNPFPATLRSGSSLPVAIDYHAIEDEPHAHELVIHSDDPEAPAHSIEIVATTTCCCCKPSCCETKPCCAPQKHCGCKPIVVRPEATKAC
jgi:hypothetical protein